jgi:methionyl-tRNA formyltransferase
MAKLRVVLAGQKYFGEQVFRLCRERGIEIAAVSCPTDDQYLGRRAALHEVPVIPAGTLRAEVMPAGVDLGLAAHSFDYVGRKTRYRARLGWIGYHPSLLPRHRGRSAVEWAIRMNDPVTGGTIYWLDHGIDRGPIAYQDWCFIGRQDTARSLWREKLLPMGLRLFARALDDLMAGVVYKTPQNPDYSTFEPSLDNIRDVYRPDLEMLPAPGESSYGVP